MILSAAAVILTKHLIHVVNYICKIRARKEELADKKTKLRLKSVVDVSSMVYSSSQVEAEVRAYVIGFVKQNLLGRNL